MSISYNNHFIDACINNISQKKIKMDASLIAQEKKGEAENLYSKELQNDTPINMELEQ